MALKLLNPGLRPLGTFDLDDDDVEAIDGGEYVQLQAEDAAGSSADGYAADVGNVGPMGPGTAGALDGNALLWNFGLNACIATSLGGLADEGIEEYGTLFGSLIGANTGQATSQSGAVVIGPGTHRGSGKVTVWHAPGLYGVNGQATDDATAPIGDTTTVNDGVYSTAAGLLTSDQGDGSGDQLGTYCGAVTDSSLVSTTNAAAGSTEAALEYHAIYLLGLYADTEA